MIVYGVDVGLSGALAIVGGRGATVSDMPTIPGGAGGKRVGYDVSLCREYLAAAIGAGAELVAIERQQVRPGQGVRSMFSSGWGQGLWEGLCAAYPVRYVLVEPVRWRRHFSLPKGKGASAAAAQRLFPSVDLRGPAGGLKDGRADALLIAAYAAAAMA